MMDVTGITEIGLNRGPCFGTWPVFRFTATRDAGYTYDGQWHVEPLGVRTGKFPG